MKRKMILFPLHAFLLLETLSHLLLPKVVLSHIFRITKSLSRRTSIPISAGGIAAASSTATPTAIATAATAATAATTTLPPATPATSFASALIPFAALLDHFHLDDTLFHCRSYHLCVAAAATATRRRFA